MLVTVNIGGNSQYPSKQGFSTPGPTYGNMVIWIVDSHFPFHEFHAEGTVVDVGPDHTEAIADKKEVYGGKKIRVSQNTPPIHPDILDSNHAMRETQSSTRILSLLFLVKLALTPAVQASDGTPY